MELSFGTAEELEVPRPMRERVWVQQKWVLRVHAFGMIEERKWLEVQHGIAFAVEAAADETLKLDVARSLQRSHGRVALVAAIDIGMFEGTLVAVKLEEMIVAEPIES
jgi:hypothetical protein